MLPIVNADALPLVLLLATGVNRIVAMFVTPLFQKFKWDNTYILYVSILLGLLAAFGFNADAFAATVNPIVGLIVTGLAIGGGASFVHDWLDSGAAIKS